jgi:hypothetical protein
MTAALIGLAGVIVEALLKTVFDLVVETRRWRREDRLRYDEERLDAYVGLLRAGREVADFELQAMAAPYFGTEAVATPRYIGESLKLHRDFTSAYQRVAILGSATVRRAVAEYRNVVPSAITGPRDPVAGVVEGMRAYDAGEDAILAVIRKELGIPDA